MTLHRCYLLVHKPGQVRSRRVKKLAFSDIKVYQFHSKTKPYSVAPWRINDAILMVGATLNFCLFTVLKRICKIFDLKYGATKIWTQLF